MSEHSSSSSSRSAPAAAAVIVAAGAGRRVGGPVRKQYLEVRGEPVLLRAVRPFVQHPRVLEVVVVLPADDAADPPAWLTALGVRVVAGGAERGDSVWNGLQALSTAGEVVLIHDGARPFVSAAVIDRVLAAAVDGGAIAALPATDTFKLVGEDGRVQETADRSRLWHAQTPQGFPREVILAAHRRARREGMRATDDAALCEACGIPVRVVEGAPENLKITRPADLTLAEALARRLL